MLQTGTETMSVSLVQTESVIIVNEAGTIIQERGLFTPFLDIVLDRKSTRLNSSHP